jgi:MinD-like ATPase involved in chromosome partitioning or flagellar assembly/Tfp pilus assembly protein PilF
MKTITFYSYKGGVGRTLALANIAKRLSEFGKKVCIIDFDLEAPGLHLKFKENIKETELSLGLVDYIQHFLCNNSIPDKFEDFVTKITFSGKKSKMIKLIPAGKSFTPEYWKTLAGIDWVKLFYKKNSQGTALFADLKERIRKELVPDYLLIDSRTGISEITGITMSIMADEIVLLSVKNEENINGLKQIIKSVALPENSLTGKVPKLTFVLSRIPYFEKPEEKIIEIRAVNEVVKDLTQFVKENNLPFNFEKIHVIHSEPRLELEERLMMGYHFEKDEEKDSTLLSIRKNYNVLPIDYLTLFEDITKDNLSQAEISHFNKIKKAEYLLEQSRKTNSSEKKLKLIQDALKLNPNLHEAYYILALEEIKVKNYNDSLNYINKAIDLQQTSIDYICLKGSILHYLGKDNESLEIFKNILLSDNKNLIALSTIGIIHNNHNKYDDALKYFKRIVEAYPEFYGGYNSLADTYKYKEEYSLAFDNIYKALELAPTDYICHATLAELNGRIGNDNEFYKNFELSLIYGNKESVICENMKNEFIYKKYIIEPRFIRMLKKYNVVLKEKV